MAYFVYILFSESFNKFYVGQTNNLDERLKRHNNKYEKATAPYAPWIRVWSCEKLDRGAALILEKKFKNLSKSRLLDFIKKYSPPGAETKMA